MRQAPFFSQACFNGKPAFQLFLPGSCLLELSFLLGKSWSPRPWRIKASLFFTEACTVRVLLWEDIIRPSLLPELQRCAGAAENNFTSCENCTWGRRVRVLCFSLVFDEKVFRNFYSKILTNCDLWDPKRLKIAFKNLNYTCLNLSKWGL